MVECGVTETHIISRVKSAWLVGPMIMLWVREIYSNRSAQGLLLLVLPTIAWFALGGEGQAHGEGWARVLVWCECCVVAELGG